MDKSYKKFLMPMMAVLLCLMMAVTCVYAAFAMDKTIHLKTETPVPDNDNSNATNTAGGLPLPSDHDVRKVETFSQLPIGKVQANYVNRDLVDPVEITNKYQLMAWLISENNADRDAKLMGDIVFDWGVNAADSALSGGALNSDGQIVPYRGAPLKLAEAYFHTSNRTDVNNIFAKIYQGRVLDGCGFTITYGSTVCDAKTISTDVSFFAKEIMGTIKNVTFNVPGTNKYSINNDASDKVFKIGFLCVQMTASAVMSNVKIDFASNMFGKYSGSASSVVLGIVAAENAGTMNYCEVKLWSGSMIKGQANSNIKFGAFGGYGYIGSQGARLNNCTFDFDYNTLNVFSQCVGWDNGCSISGIFGDAANSQINGFIVKNADFKSSPHPIKSTGVFKWYYFVPSSSGAVAKNLYLLNNTTYKPTAEESNYGIVRIEQQPDYDILWDRTTVDRLVVKRKTLSNSNILWSINQANGKSYDTLYKYMISAETLVSVPANTPEIKTEGGSVMTIFAGEVGKLDSMRYVTEGITTVNDPNKPNAKINTAVYTGKAFKAEVVFKNMKGDTAWNNTASFAIYYKGLLANPVIPGTYITTVQSISEDKDDVSLFSYFDSVNRRLVIRDDNFTLNNFTLTIKRGDTNIVSKKVNNIDYIDGQWTNVPVQVRLEVLGILPEYLPATRPNVVKATFDTKEDQAGGKNIEWIEVKNPSDVNTYYNYSLSLSCTDKPIRFAFFRDDVQLTEISDSSVLSKVDLDKPTFELDELSHRGSNPKRDLSKWMDRYNADGNKDDNQEVSQVWIRVKSGPSGSNLSARGRRMDSQGNYGDFSPWGTLAYQPLDNGSIIDPNVYAQKMYDPLLTREQNAEKVNGTWEIEFKMVNGVGVPAIIKGSTTNEQIIKVVVKVDYNDYNLNADEIKRLWHGSDMNGSEVVALDNQVCDITVKYTGDRKFFFRNEAMKYNVVTKELRESVGYTLATANGITVPKANKFDYEASYNHSSDLPIGTQPDINVTLRKYIKGGISILADQEYGNLPPNVSDKISIPETVHDSITLIYAYTPSVSDAKGDIKDINNKKLSVGKYNINVKAVVNTGDTLFDEKCNQMYEIDVVGSSYNVTQKKITLEFIQSTLSSSLRNFNNRYVKVKDFTSQLVEGDTVAVTSIYPKDAPKEEDLINGTKDYVCFAVLNNANYTVINTCNVTLSKFLTDTEDQSVFLLETPDDILAINSNLLSAKFKLRNDIDFMSKSIQSIGDFSGIFDGNGYAIKNLKILENTNIVGTYNIGLFSKLLPGAEIKNLVLSNITVDVKTTATTNYNVGVLAGTANGAKINNISIQATVYAMGEHKNTAAGVLFGRADNVEITKVMTVATVYFAKSITNIDKQNIIGGGVAGELKNSKLTNVAAINQGYINSNISNGAGYIAAQPSNNTYAPDVTYLDKGILNGGKVLISDNMAKIYSNLLSNITKYGELQSQTIRGGKTFKDIMIKLIPQSMRANGLNRLEVHNFRDLVFMLNYNFADYKIMKDIYCFNGFDYKGTYQFAGNILNEGGFKIYSDNGVFDIGTK